MRRDSSLQRTLQPVIKPVIPIIPIISLAAILCLAIGCASPASPAPLAPTPVPARATPTRPPASTAPSSPTPRPSTQGGAVEGLSDEAAATLNSLEKVDDYPLYTMRYTGAYSRGGEASGEEHAFFQTQNIAPLATPLPALPPAWGCSLFAVPGQADNGLYGRNFDWLYSPAVLLFTAPPDGYASVSMVAIAYTGLEQSKAGSLADLPLQERQALLRAPLVPFDGMNEYGLAVGLAAVPLGKTPPQDPNKETINSLRAIREVLDHTRTADEAVALLQSYNIDMMGGPPVHYLIADAAGRSALVEFDAGKMVIIANKNAWHLATNHLYAAGDETGHSGCWRYDKMYGRLAETGGQLATQDALDLLAGVSLEDTQWSAVYGMKTGDVNVAMGRKYTAVHTFHLPLAGR